MEKTETIGHQDFRNQFEALVNLYKPEVTFMLNLAINVIFNALNGSETKEEYTFYLEAIKKAMVQVEQTCEEKYNGV